jgi:hypothetical protein
MGHAVGLRAFNDCEREYLPLPELESMLCFLAFLNLFN